MVVGAVATGLMALVLMVTMMSDPATPWVGLVPAADGAPTLVVQREGARGVTEISVEAGGASRDVLWSIDRVPGADWDGVVPIGTVPPAFRQRVPQGEGPLPAGSTIVVTNGCYASYLTMPRGTLEPGVVTTEDGPVLPDEFSSDGGGFTPCGSADLDVPLAIAGGGVALFVVGLVLLVVSAARRRTA
ncbi:hypothetical protein EDF34_1375 [Cellulomonas sp. PhB150]|nr:hypothetical protein EDF34_1375 [Cellulomonas sp. PhB150]